MNVLVLGCGEMAQIAIRELATSPSAARVTVAARRPDLAAAFCATLPKVRHRVTVEAIDVRDHSGLVALMRGQDVTCNLAGPYYLNGVAVVKAAIAARVPLVDACDDWEATLEQLALHEAAAAAGITIIVGLGASPGVTNIMARAAANRLDRVDEVHTAWVMRGSDPGGLALCRHLLHSLPHRAFVFEGGTLREVVPFRDGCETLKFPQLGEVPVFHIGHPEPLTLSRSIAGVQYADNKATFLPAQVNDLIVRLGAIARPARPVLMSGKPVDSMEFAAHYLHQTCKAMAEVPKTAALRAEVRGMLRGKRTRIVYAAAGRIGVGTGVPVAIGAYLIAQGEVSQPGVFPPEAGVDPDLFFDEVTARQAGEVEEEFIQE